jgi:hypothetical protein
LQHEFENNKLKLFKEKLHAISGALCDLMNGMGWNSVIETMVPKTVVLILRTKTRTMVSSLWRNNDWNYSLKTMVLILKTKKLKPWFHKKCLVLGSLNVT